MLNNQEFQTPVLIKDLGTQFPTEKSKHKARFGLYKCSCGNEFRAIISTVKHGHTKSCGCYKNKLTSIRNTSHNLCSHRLYYTWQSMIYRVRSKNAVNYKYYGGRGIKVCDRWLDINSFIEDMYPTYKEGLTLDRIDVNGNYEPSNCRWATREVQNRNTRLLGIKNTSGYRGVTYCEKPKKWCAKITVSNKYKNIGYFTTAIDAAIAYDSYVIENNLEHTLNFNTKA